VEHPRFVAWDYQIARIATARGDHSHALSRGFPPLFDSLLVQVKSLRRVGIAPGMLQGIQYDIELRIRTARALR
jgi:hypothetical protein